MKINDKYYCEECHIELDGDFDGDNMHVAYCGMCEQPHHFCSRCAKYHIPESSPSMTKDEFEKMTREAVHATDLLNELVLKDITCDRHQKMSCSICGSIVFQILIGLGMVLFIDKTKRISTPSNEFLTICISGKDRIEIFKEEVWRGLYNILTRTNQ